MNRQVNPKVFLGVPVAIIALAVAFVVIVNHRMDQQSERARLAAEAAQRQASPPATTPATTEPYVEEVDPEAEAREAEANGRAYASNHHSDLIEILITGDLDGRSFNGNYRLLV